MKTPTQFLLACLLLDVTFSIPAAACLNDYKPNRAIIERSHSLRDELVEHKVNEDWMAREVRLRKELEQGGDYRVKNDLATTLAHTGKTAEAVTLLEQIEAEHPGLYATATNLGTACELSGDNRKALEWIKKGIERNPESHNGTEWLHVRILEAKLALTSDPGWLESNSVLGPRDAEGKVRISVADNRGQAVTDETAKAALNYQLHERLQFVKAPDTIVGSMLSDLGDLIANESQGIGGAAEIYGLAKEYLAHAPNVHTLEGSLDQPIFLAENAQLLPRRFRFTLGHRDFVTFLALIAAFGFFSWLLVVRVSRLIRRRTEKP